ncbi:MAG: UvrB/UvrC motif-containing protein [Ignavibacteriaceae bacterium]|nr:UvrB/UvrC motif-containing protein [Ignavibacteriaceae bacterium]
MILKKEIEQVRREKAAIVKRQDYEEAARLQRQEKKSPG